MSDNATKVQCCTIVALSASLQAWDIGDQGSSYWMQYTDGIGSIAGILILVIQAGVKISRKRKVVSSSHRFRERCASAPDAAKNSLVYFI